MLPAVHLVPLAVCLGAAAFLDLTKRTIPNVLTVIVAVLGVGVQLSDNGLLAALWGLAVAVLSVVVLYPAWLAGGIGGGDVKLAAAVAIWIGWPHFIMFALVTALVGGVVAGVCYGVSNRGVRREINANLVGALLMRRLPSIESGTSSMVVGGGPRVSVPYGIAVAIGAAVAVWAPLGL